MGQGSGLRLPAIVLLGAVLLLGACETRSISNSGYAGPGGGRGNPFYQGELTEFDLLGIDVSRSASDEDIVRELDKRQKVGVHRGGTMMVIQSGALIPDDAMVKQLDRYFAVMPFTGIPLVHRDEPLYHTATLGPSPVVTDERITNYARALRLAAAKSGADVIFCYWGLIESAVEREPTKAVSWVPFIGAAVPDEAQLMRIRLKVAVIDVRTGQWSMFVPDAYVDSALSASLTRASSDQHQVELLKQQAYKSAVEAFVEKYAG